MKKKLFLILWCPDTASVPNKMLYASSYEALKQSLVGIQKYIQVWNFYSLYEYFSLNTFDSVYPQANDDDEAAQETVEEILRSTDRN